jgi:hypothetical protein
MAYRIRASSNYGEDFLTINGVLNRLSLPNAPAELRFPALDLDGTVWLLTNQKGTIDFGPEERSLRCAGLMTCAAACFVSSASTRGYVLHAGSGELNPRNIRAAFDAVGADDPRTVYVAYAHPKDGEDVYARDVQALIDVGIPTGQIVHITNLPASTFGMNSRFQLGH